MASEKATPAEWMLDAANEIYDTIDLHHGHAGDQVTKMAQIIAAHSPAPLTTAELKEIVETPIEDEWVASERPRSTSTCPRCGSHNRDFFIGHARIDKKENSCYPEDHDPWHD
jgi:hypothetical protein